MIRVRSSPRPLALWKQIENAKEPSAQKPRQFIRRESPKRAALMRKYRARVKDWLREGPRFQPKQCLCCLWRGFSNVKTASECHHRNGRISGLLLDERWWVPICSSCHTWIHTHIEAARALGLICAKGAWNKPVTHK